METWGAGQGVVWPVPARELTQAQRRAASSEWGEHRRCWRGWYVLRVAGASPRQRVADAGVLLVPPSAVTGWGSLAWQGARWFEGTYGDLTPRPVVIASPRRLFRPRPEVLVCEERFDPREVVVVDGLRVTDAVRATCFEMRYAPNLRAAVRALDMACYDDLVSIEEVSAWVSVHPSYTGIEQARLAIPLGDENAWSPAEVDFRLDWTELVGRRPMTNRPIFDLSGRHLGTPDVVDPQTGVVGEFDGPVHLAEGRRAADLRREAAFREHGLHPVTMVSAERRDQSAFHARVRSAYAAASRQAADERRWTLEPPAWWAPTWTVAQRRQLGERDREVWLRYRHG
jgi:hypothetical protein